MSRFFDALSKVGEPPLVETPVPSPVVAVPPPPMAAADEMRPFATAASVELPELDRTELTGPFWARAITNPESDPAFVDEFRKLAATLHHAQVEQPGLKVISIASSAPKEGKTLTAINLALTMRVSYRRRVLLIDADLRVPSLHRWLDLPMSPGLTDMIGWADEAPWPVVDVIPGLALLPAGTRTRDPISRLSAPRMRQIIADARDRYDWVIVDLSPVGPSPDALLVTALSDGALVVVDAGHVPARVIQRAVDAIGEQKVIGVVLNRMPPTALGDVYGGYPQHYAANNETPR